MSACKCGRPANHAGLCARVCTVEACDEQHFARGYCGAHYRRWRRYGDPLGTPSNQRLMPPLHIEDVEWMAETGENWENAARRVGFTLEAFEKALQRAGRADLIRRLKRHRIAVSA